MPGAIWGSLLKQHCASTLRAFFGWNVSLAGSRQDSRPDWFLTHTNLIAQWANLGHVEEVAIRNRILQSLIGLSVVRDHQADALIILFKLAGATFEAYAGPLVVDRCFELLKCHYSHDSAKWKLVQVRSPCTSKGSHCAKTKS